MTDVPAGTSTFPVGNEIRSTTRDGRRRAPGRGCRHCTQTTSAGSWTGGPQFWQVRIAISLLSGGKPLLATIPPADALALGIAESAPCEAIPYGFRLSR